MAYPVRLKGQGASGGIAIGPAHVVRKPSRVERQTVKPGQEPQEAERLRSALRTARQELQRVGERVSGDLGDEQGAIFEAHLLMLQDPELSGKAEEAILSQSVTAEGAIQQAGQAVSSTLAAFEDEYLRARADDVRDVVSRVISVLRGDSADDETYRMGEPAVVVAEELMPSDTARMDRTKVLGFLSERGSTTSHAAILARTMGVPAVVGAPGSLRAIQPHDAVVLDGNAGIVVVRPGPVELRDWEAKRRALRRRDELARSLTALPPVTTDGCRLDLAANIGSTSDLKIALSYGAEEIGLFRTEVLFLDRECAPTEEEQFQAYRLAAEAMHGRRVIIRTLDIGGDKRVPWLDRTEEANPFLGLRGIRFCLRHSEMFVVQLKALLRASACGDVWIMLPMVSDVAEIRLARALLARARQELSAGGEPLGDPPLGIMIEVPGAAVLADAFLREADFASIGTNDLTQYSLAGDRTNERVAELADALHPAVLRLVRGVARAGQRQRKWVGVCGDIAGDPLATPVLLGLGVSELSMAPPLLPYVKEVVRRTSLTEARRIAQRVLRCHDAREVRTRLERGVESA